MGWTQRQQAMLGAMGLRLWQRSDLVVAQPQPAASTQAANPVVPARPGGTAAVPATPSAVANPADVQARPVPPSASTKALPAAPLATPAVGVQRGDVAALGWPALRQAVAACTACGLCQSRTQPVFGSGAEQAHWLVVGEAPGEQEDLQGLPFVGRSGELLQGMLAALKLTRAEGAGPEGLPDVPAQRRVFVANTVKCRPPKNRNPTAEELSACEPFLLRQIELLQPRIILALGAFAIKALLRSDEPVGKLRGRVHRYQGVPVVVSYHPAYLLRQPLEKARAWEDLCLAADTAEAAVLANENPASASGR